MTTAMPSATSLKKPRPWILIAAYLIAVVGTSFVDFFGTYLPQIFGFTGLAAWLAFRAGNVTKLTFVVPMVLILVTCAEPVLTLTVLGNYQSVQYRTQPRYFWDWCIRPVLLQWIVFVIISRATGIHLRPINTHSATKPMSISLIMLLTAAFAFCFAVDIYLSRSDTFSQISSSTLSGLSGFAFYILTNGLYLMLFLGIIVLFLQSNAIKSIGLLLICFWVVGAMAQTYLYYQFVWPQMKLEIDSSNQGNKFASPAMAQSNFAVVWQYAVHMVLTFVTVSLFHLAGYRWDRSTQRHTTDATAKEKSSFADVE